MLNKDEQIELANKQILANASAELLEYSKFLNGGALPNDARLLGKNAGRMILKSLNAGASKLYCRKGSTTNWWYKCL